MLFTSCLIIFYGSLPGSYEWIRKCVIDNVKYESLLKNCCGRMDDIYSKQKKNTQKNWAKTFLMRVSVNESSKKKKPKKNILSVISSYVFYVWINSI